jgi:putative cardiolipin synthase
MTYPIELLDPDSVTVAALDKLRQKLAANAHQAEKSHYAKALASNDSIKQLLSGGDWPAEWVTNYQFISDNPSKVTTKESASMTTEVSAALDPILAAMSQGTRIISPYFVPGEPFTKELVKHASAGKSVRILTNSLVANDVAAVHGGYATYRKQLLEGGVELWELKPIAGEKEEKEKAEKESGGLGSSGASLHAKGFSIDERFVFIGSYNLDPRSTWLNCEQGVLVTSPELAKQFAGIFTTQTEGTHSWKVTLDKEKDLSWTDGKETFDSEPHASAWLRFQAWFARVFNLEAQL